jgi:hypothetical protein
LLKNYYKEDNDMGSQKMPETTVDLNANGFDPELYLNKMIKVKHM